MDNQALKKNPCSQPLSCLCAFVGWEGLWNHLCWEKKEGMNLGRGNDNCSGSHTLSGLIRSFAFKWRHLQSWLITPYSGVNPQTTLLSSFQTEAQTEGNSLWVMVDTWCRDHWPPSSVSTIFISTSAFKMKMNHNPLRGTKCLLSEGQQSPGLWENRT